MVLIVSATLAMPLLYWLWLGVTFTLIDYTLHIIYRQYGVTAMDMVNALHKVASDEARGELDRLVRYTDIRDPDYPGTLSIYNPKKNLIIIDRELADQLTEVERNYLEMTYIKRTRLSGKLSTIGFVEYNLIDKV